ncbi:MAG: acyl carrier protein [Chlamydiota bacterium]|nr:acyl carrier protein [Chlamydiota bacterium]
MSISKEEIEQSVINIIIDRLKIDSKEKEVTRNTKLVEDLNADSLDATEIVMEFEEKFGCDIPEEDGEKLTTVGECIDYIAEKMGK